MDWIKRNLFIVVGAVVALALMGCAFFFLYSQYSENDQAKTALGEKYAELKQLIAANPHPGNDKIDNIKLAREQQAQVKAAINQLSSIVRPIAPIPDFGDRALSDSQFAGALRATAEQLRRDALNASVGLSTNYYFTFEVQKTNLNFGKDSLKPLATQLGEIKAICDIIFAARVNSLDGIRRERVTPDDSQGFTDYHDNKTVTNDLATLAPYEVTLRCFSAELGKLLAGFANSPNAILVKKINVQPGTSTMAGALAMGGDAPVGYPAMGGRYPNMGGYPMQGFPVATAARGKRGYVTKIEEAPVTVTLWLDVVKLKPPGTK
jgi:hypothetical protein